MKKNKTKQEAFRLLFWCLKTLFQKEDASISFEELREELENAWNELVDNGDIVITE